ncbi:MAG: YgaP-like transmembrane domain [Actinomycetota bacterium]
MVAGLKKGGKLGLVLSGAGVVLLTTGATEHCPVNSALGIDTSE